MGDEMAPEMPGAQALPRCSSCDRPSVLRLRSPDHHLCAEHLVSDISERMRTAITSHAMIRAGDRIAVALSGGKDSTALLLLLCELLAGREDVTLVAITVDEGIAGYRNDTIRSAENLAREMGVEHRMVSFSGLFGNDLDAMLTGREERACSICGILRRKALVYAARAAGATKLATGHNLDDEAQSVLMNVLRGDLDRLVRASGSLPGEWSLPRIKPLRDVSEKEIAVYLSVKDRFPELPECPYTRYALRADIRSRLNLLEFRHPGTMRNLVEGKERLSSVLSGLRPDAGIARCRECGDPCPGTVCRACSLIKDLRG